MMNDYLMIIQLQTPIGIGFEKSCRVTLRSSGCEFKVLVVQMRIQGFRLSDSADFCTKLANVANDFKHFLKVALHDPPDM